MINTKEVCDEVFKMQFRLFVVQRRERVGFLPQLRYSTEDKTDKGKKTPVSSVHRQVRFYRHVLHRMRQVPVEGGAGSCRETHVAWRHCHRQAIVVATNKKARSCLVRAFSVNVQYNPNSLLMLFTASKPIAFSRFLKHGVDKIRIKVSDSS